MAKKGKNSITILHEDEDLVIVQKPANYLSIPDRFDAEKPNLYHYLQKKYGSIFIVHRLDKETSGLICFAKNEEAHKHLSEQFFEHTVDKVYLALVEGSLHTPEGRIEKAIGKHPAIPGKMIITKRGKKSLTLYKVVEEFKAYSLVETIIKTGRTHQIRIHLESIGHPLMIDSMYGRQDSFYLSSLKLRKYKIQKDVEERPLMSRTTLHSYRLSFIHPRSKEKVTFENPLPKDFGAVLKQLRKWG